MRNGGGPASGLGLDLGSSAVKFALIQTSPSGLVLRHAGIAKLAPDIVRDGVVLNPRALKETLRQLIPPHCGQVDRCTISVPSDQAQIRWVSMPEMPTHDFHAAVQMRARKVFDDTGAETTVRGSDPVPSFKQEGIDSLLISVATNVLETRAEAVAGAGLRPTNAELEAQALLRMLNRTLSRRNSPTREGSWTMVDFGMKRTQMLVVQNQRLQFLRGVRFGGSRFEAKLVENLGLSNDDAVAHLHHEKSFLSPEGHFVTPERKHVDMSQPLEALMREFTRLLRYFRSLHPERSYGGVLDNVMLSGGLSGMPGLSEAVEARLGLRVEVLRPFSGLRIDLETQEYLSVMQKQASFATATGLALSGLDESHKEGRSADEFVWRRAS